MNDPAESNVDVEGVACFAWRGGSGGATLRNFGDELGPLIVAEMVTRLVPGPEPVRPARRLLSVGSVLHFADATDVVWGSGINGKIQRQRYPARLDVRAVRGPLTRAALLGHGIRVPQVYGDPALLVATLFPELRRRSETAEVVVPNLNELDRFAGSAPLLDPRAPVWDVLEAIAGADFVTGTSLHALIIADALGIPSRPIVPHAEHAWKYIDYYLGTGRPDIRFARDLDEARQLGGVPLPDFDVEGLRAAFPVDLWGADQPISVAAAHASSFASLRREADRERKNVVLSGGWRASSEHALAVARLDLLLARDLPHEGFTREEAEITDVPLAERSSDPSPQPTLSVIVPVHNVALWVGETLRSVLAQNVEDMEVIVVDDHSTDRTVAVVEEFVTRDPRVRLIEAISRGGGTARNIGADQARGKYLVFCDGDDLVPDGAYAAMVSSLDRTGSDMVVGDYLKFSPTDVWSPTESMSAYKQSRDSIAVTEAPSLIYSRPCWNKAFRRRFWEDNRIQFPDVPRSNDIVPMMNAYIKAARIDVIRDIVYLYRERPGATSMTAKSASVASLLSYFAQEEECARIAMQAHDAALSRVHANLIYERDAFVHVSKYLLAAQGDGVDEHVVAAVRSLLSVTAPPNPELDPLKRACFSLLAAADQAGARAAAGLRMRPDAPLEDRLRWWATLIRATELGPVWINNAETLASLSRDLTEIPVSEEARLARASVSEALDRLPGVRASLAVPELLSRPDLSLIDVQALRERASATVTDVEGRSQLVVRGASAIGADRGEPAILLKEPEVRIVRPTGMDWREGADGDYEWVARFRARDIPRNHPLTIVMWDGLAKAAVAAAMTAEPPEYSAMNRFLVDPAPAGMTIVRRRHWLPRAVRRGVIRLLSRVGRR